MRPHDVFRWRLQGDFLYFCCGDTFVFSKLAGFVGRRVR